MERDGLRAGEIESRRLRCAAKTREGRDDAEQKGKKREEWSEANGEARQRGSDNREKSSRREAMMRKRGRRRTNGGVSVWQQDVLCACQSLTKDQDLCDTSALNL